MVREREPLLESKDLYPISVTVRPQGVLAPLPEMWEDLPACPGSSLASRDPSTAFSSAFADENFAQDDIVVGFMCLFVYLLESRMTLTSTGREGHDFQSCRPEPEEIAASVAGGQECGSSQRCRPQRLKPIIRSVLYGATQVAPFPFVHVARTSPTVILSGGRGSRTRPSSGVERSLPLSVTVPPQGSHSAGRALGEFPASPGLINEQGSFDCVFVRLRGRKLRSG